MKRSDFKISKTQDGWRLTNVRDSGDRHAHFFNKNGAKLVLQFIIKGVLPDKDYFKRSARRLLLDRDFKKLVPGKKPKPRYVNVKKKGVRSVGKGRLAR